MEVLLDSDSPVLISNAEVMSLLGRKVKARKNELAKMPERRRKQQESKSRHSDWIEGKVYDYLKTSPCVHAKVSKLNELHSKLTSSKRQRQSADPTSNKDPPSGRAATTSFGLTEAEAIQISNFMPTEPVEIHLMVEELHNRMTETKQEELLQCIASYRKDPK